MKLSSHPETTVPNMTNLFRVRFHSSYFILEVANYIPGYRSLRWQIVCDPEAIEEVRLPAALIPNVNLPEAPNLVSRVLLDTTHAVKTFSSRVDAVAFATNTLGLPPESETSTKSLLNSSSKSMFARIRQALSFLSFRK